jgi:predicted amidophosphoribosyltransferase
VEEPKHHLAPQSRYGLEPVREAFLALGEAAPDFLAGLKHRHPHHCGFHARFILRLKQHYHADDIHAALRHALRYQAYDGKAIERILKVKATPRSLESHRFDQARAILQKALPKITQRELSEYCQLFSNKKDESDG